LDTALGGTDDRESGTGVMAAELSGLNLHHIGFVVPDIVAGVSGFVRSLGATWDGLIYEDPYQAVKVTFLTIGPGAPQIELVEPAGEHSPVLRFLREGGGGIHHICYEVANLDRHMAAMKSRGCLIARRAKPAVAFQGRRIAWMLTAEKLLVELLEESGPRDRAGYS
jgi:methylmalonyl-CoA/ethylmalonyl-CoA epimerase